jgi:hypothetical protein
MKSLREAAAALLDRYVGLVNCGDCGHWNPEEEDEVIALRSALAAEGGRVYWRVDHKFPEWFSWDRGDLHQSRQKAQEEEAYLRSKWADAATYRIVRVCETVEPESEGGGK